MKLSVDNLGSIVHADIDIAPLTVFIGPNNTNKTWAAYSLYALAGLFASQRLSFLIRQRSDLVTSVVLDSRLEKNIKDAAKNASDFIWKSLESSSGTSITSTTQRSELLAGVSFPMTLCLEASELASVLAIPVDQFPGARATIELTAQDSPSSPEFVTFTTQKLPDNHLQIVTEHKHTGTPSPLQFPSRIPQSEDQQQLKAYLTLETRKLALSMLGNVTAFPAERVSLVTLYAALQIGNAAGVVLSQPVTDFTQFLQMSSWYALAVPAARPSPFNDISALLQGKLLNGKTQFAQSQQFPKPLEFAIPSGQRLRIHAASSLVKSLAGLAVYLLTAEPNDMIIIDEPEMNAHPEAQLAIAELLAILVNRGIRVVITTHSPYLVDHINNLIQANNLTGENRAKVTDELILKQQESLLARKQVEMYWFEKGGVVNPIYDKETGLFDLTTFGDQSDYVNNLNSTILELGRGE